MNALVSVDWLELFCDFSHFRPTSSFKVVNRAYGTRFFENAADVEFDQMPLCSISWSPRSAIIRTKTGIVKVSNRQLYERNGHFHVDRFLTECGISVLSISRIDIAVDFQVFSNGLPPESFVQYIMQGDWALRGRKEISASGSVSGRFLPTYIRWGSRTSDLQVYLYNKSKELRDVKDKFYIRELWNRLGFSENVDTWRLEFSLRGRMTRIQLGADGYNQPLSFDLLRDKEFLRCLSDTLIGKYFSVVKVGSDSNKSRWRNVQLFDFDYKFIKIVVPRNEVSSKRSDKVFAKRLWKLAYQSHVRDLRRIHDAALIYEEFIYNTHLVRWARDNENSWEREGFRE